MNIQQIADLLEKLPALVQQLLVLAVLGTGALATLATALSGVFALFHYHRGVDYMASLGIDFAKFIALLQGFQPKNREFVKIDPDVEKISGPLPVSAVTDPSKVS
jgi:hypothetical protein